jgi:hypothetical protein
MLWAEPPAMTGAGSHVRVLNPAAAGRCRS